MEHTRNLGKARYFSLLATAGTFAGLLCTMAARPAIAEQEPDDPRIEVIIVTAEKREESVLEVPLTMTAFSSEIIRELGMTGEEDLEEAFVRIIGSDEGLQ